jgi:hypothetical protein
MNFNIKLCELPDLLKKFLSMYLIVLSFGVTIGLYYVSTTTKSNISGIVERWNGSETKENEIPEQYEKSIQEMLMTTHNHILGFSFIFLQIGLIFYFNSIISEWMKAFLLIEPFLSIIFTFGGIWLMRFIDPGFVYLTALSGTVMYSTLYAMIIISLYEMNFKKNIN